MPNWSYNPPMGVGQQGSVVQNANGGTPLIGGRSIQDARRMMQTGRAPQAQYPDGYLGTLIDRRQDRVMTAIQGRLTQRQYQRGVHKGERIDLSDYFWRPELNLMSGIEAEQRGERWTARGNEVERLAHLGKVNALSPAEMWKLNKVYYPEDPNALGQTNPKRVAQLAHLRPAWS
jgi:hypothetical protein